MSAFHWVIYHILWHLVLNTFTMCRAERYTDHDFSQGVVKEEQYDGVYPFGEDIITMYINALHIVNEPYIVRINPIPGCILQCFCCHLLEAESNAGGSNIVYNFQKVTFCLYFKSQTTSCKSVLLLMLKDLVLYFDSHNYRLLNAVFLSHLKGKDFLMGFINYGISRIVKWLLTTQSPACSEVSYLVGVPCILVSGLW